MTAGAWLSPMSHLLASPPTPEAVPAPAESPCKSYELNGVGSAAESWSSDFSPFPFLG